VQFLELVDAHKMNAERQQMRDEEQELKDFRNRVEKLQEENVDKVCLISFSRWSHLKTPNPSIDHLPFNIITWQARDV